MSVTVLIVDDSSFFRKRVAEILSSVADIKVVGAASNGREGVELAKKLKPDVITMDYEMPVMDGVTAVRHIMAESPTPILMFSSLTYEGARVTLDALEAGAVDFLPKNFEDIARDTSKMQEVLKSRILAIAKPSARKSVSAPDTASPASTATLTSKPATTQRPIRSSTTKSSVSPAPKASAKSGAKSKISHPVELLVIGASTGGPVALQKVLTKLPANLSVPVLVIQHMPATFTPAFAERLDSLCKVKVKHASDGDALRPGQVLLAPGGKQMLVTNNGRQIAIVDGDDRLTYKPSVDITFGSAAKALPGKVLGAVLTGMGADGREGCRLLKKTNSTVWTQTEKSCVIYGMPMAVDKAGFSDESVDISQFGERIISGLG